VFTVLAAYAFTCADLRLQTKNNNYFFPERHKKKRKKKKGYAFLTAMQRRLSRF
jgi:hypothetical protein